MSVPLRSVMQIVWTGARILLIAGYTAAFAVSAAVALRALGLESDAATIYAPALFALPLAAGGVHYLFGPELRRRDGLSR